MIHLPTALWAHLIGDAAAWASAAGVSYWQYKKRIVPVFHLSERAAPSYLVTLGVGAILGAWLFGSLNTMRTALFVPSHSIAGALAGGIIGVELWKWRNHIRFSTGASFVLPIAVGIAVGRFGCLFSGLPDFTYGVPTTLPWAVDLGDGIGRHPVQMYEAGSMALFAGIYLWAILKRQSWALRHGFQVMIIVYGAQRFIWEFLKPYPPLLGSFNIFHFLTIGMICYGLVWLFRGRAAYAG